LPRSSRRSRSPQTISFKAEPRFFPTLKDITDPKISKLREDYEKYKKTPENHPEYGSEWQIWWQKRYKEISAEGKYNPNDYDYKPEWKEFWMNRMREIFKKAIGEDPENGKVQQPLPLAGGSQTQRKRARTPDTTISIDDSSSDESERSRRSKTSRSESRRYRYESPPRSKPSYRENESSSHSYDRYDRDETISFVTVFRRLSGLEQDLGLFAPKVLDILSKAIELEKLDPSSSGEALMTSENLNFLETLREKLKGILMVNEMSSSKTEAIKKSIQNIAKLIHKVPVQEESQARPVVVNDEAAKKAKIAEELVNILRDLGKEDISGEELEVLIETMMSKEDEPVQPVVQPVVQTVPTVQADETRTMSDHDLKILLSNFEELRRDEQDNLIKHLEIIETNEPERAKTLRTFLYNRAPNDFDFD
jgi:hypothetical protein